MRAVFQDPSIVAFRRDKNLCDVLVHGMTNGGNEINQVISQTVITVLDCLEMMLLIYEMMLLIYEMMLLIYEMMLLIFSYLHRLCTPLLWTSASITEGYVRDNMHGM